MMSKDRRRLKGTAMARLLYDFVPNRVDATVYMNHKIDVTEYVKFMKKIKKDYYVPWTCNYVRKSNIFTS